MEPIKIQNILIACLFFFSFGDELTSGIGIKVCTKAGLWLLVCHDDKMQGMK